MIANDAVSLFLAGGLKAPERQGFSRHSSRSPEPGPEGHSMIAAWWEVRVIGMSLGVVLSHKFLIQIKGCHLILNLSLDPEII